VHLVVLLQIEYKVRDFLFPVLVLLLFYLVSHPLPRLFSPQSVKQFIFLKLQLKTKSFFEAAIRVLSNNLFIFTLKRVAVVQRYTVQRYTVQRYTVQRYTVQRYTIQRYTVQRYTVQRYTVQRYTVQRYTVQRYTVQVSLPYSATFVAQYTSQLCISTSTQKKMPLVHCVRSHYVG